MIPYNTDAPIYHMPLATGGIILLNTVLFFALPASLTEPENIDIVAGQLNVDYPAHTLVLEYGTLKPWQWFTSIFIHADFFHLLFNMIALWAFGLVVEGKVGPLVFCMIYLGIGVGQSAFEQAIMLFAGSGASVGASAAIFGILGVAIVWAPRNEFDVFWTFGLRGGSIEIPIMIYGFLQFALEAISITLGRFQMSSGVLHLMGLAIGIGCGFVWLKRGWVDCEGWDLISVWHGKEGKVEENAELESEARSLVQASLQKTGGKGKDATAHRSSAAEKKPNRQSGRRRKKKDRRAGEDSNQTETQEMSYHAAHSSAASNSAPADSHQQAADGLLDDLLPMAKQPTPADDIESLVLAGNHATALKLLQKHHAAGTPLAISRPILFQLIKVLLGEKRYSEAVPLLEEHAERFTQSRVSILLNLAKTLLHLERPRKALEALVPLNSMALDDRAKATRGKLVAHAKQMINDGVIELSE